MLRPIKNVFAGQEFPDLLVGLDDPDDSALWRLDDDRALVATTDFFTPVVDDPYDYGAIAAANALSDIYAMGGKPFLTLNVAGLPPALPTEISAEILRGGAEKSLEAGAALAGGHTVQDEEPKYGLVALGFVNPEKIITKGGANPGDVLVLTKPLGFGVTTTALKQQIATPEEVDEVVAWMKFLNRMASELAVEFSVRGGTDVTGFSFLGHASEVAKASGVQLRFEYSKIPFISCAARFGEEYIFPGGASDNLLHFGDVVDIQGDFEEWEILLLYDPQTSGGLLLSVPEDRYEAFAARAAELEAPAWEVGRVVEGQGITVVR